MTEPYVICIILNSNRRDDTLDCLDSLSKNTYRQYSVVVLDNHSTDGSVEAIQAKYPDVQIVHIDQNRGFGGNNNVGIKIALAQGADWVFVLNEDTILDPDCLRRMVDAGERESRIGVVGPMVYHFDEPDYIQSAGGLLGPYWESIHLGKDEVDTGKWSDVHTVEWISGCAILVNKAAIEQVGLIDERFFYYWDETEWCLRMGKAGWQILHVPQAKLWHKGVQRSYSPKPSLLYYSTRNWLLMISKHRAPFKVWVHAWFEIWRTLLSWSIKPKWRDKRAYRDAMWQGMVDFLRQRWGKQGS